MPIRVKDAARAAKKFAERAAAAGGDYAEGVKAAGSAWEEGAKNGAENFAAGVTQAIQDNRFAKGIEKAGSEKYVRRASEVGARRFPEGVRAAEGDWQRGTAPFLAVIAATELPPRRPKGDPANYDRVRVLGERLRAAKLGQTP